jgi:hypothetical protein
MVVFLFLLHCNCLLTDFFEAAMNSARLPCDITILLLPADLLRLPIRDDSGTMTEGAGRQSASRETMEALA